MERPPPRLADVPIPASFAVLRAYALKLPEVSEGEWYGGPELLFRRKCFALWSTGQGRTIMKLDRERQAARFEVRPDVFAPCKVGTGVWSFVALDALDANEIRALTLEAYATIAPKRLVALAPPA